MFSTLPSLRGASVGPPAGGDDRRPSRGSGTAGASLVRGLAVGPGCRGGRATESPPGLVFPPPPQNAPFRKASTPPGAAAVPWTAGAVRPTETLGAGAGADPELGSCRVRLSVCLPVALTTPKNPALSPHEAQRPEK